ncbi:hypothetical protein ACFOYW_15115 [Gryllotalpicola reticulitermitis]|uniref:Uncharacterized protein n=1 Tax=Gryllotalpicola reticulitermitis TaxID=1184153 RepID=A0ABV8QBK5_9MICO
MHIRGRFRRQPPDPALEVLQQARRMPVPVYGLVPQRHLEDWDALGVSSSEHDGVVVECHLSISYTLWRNPDYLDDPVNLTDDALREIDDDARDRTSGTQRKRDEPDDRPAWLIERLRRTRYRPLLWECVTTHWSARPRDSDRVEARLADHVNHILRNGFQSTRLRGAAPGQLDSPVDERHVEHGITVRVDGFERSGIRIDTDPDVYGIGVSLDTATCVTAVVPRDELRFVDLGFATRRL